MRLLRLNAPARAGAAASLMLAASAIVLGCGGTQTPPAWTPTLEPTRDPGTSDDERAVLSALDRLTTDAAGELPPTQASAGEAYTAATGRTCREIAGLASPRVACRFEEGWRFVPALRTDP